jgi:hypothetical protein
MKSKGKLGGKVETKRRDVGMKGDYARAGWPEDRDRQRVVSDESEKAMRRLSRTRKNRRVGSSK